ncbi:pentatricopeptide repeat-containing protein At1g73710 [Malania oleifera]|uniref:pentatricopeptide repeat-containing protein At1g73710 n=1 Tax=Malania oleifera TaxID=397392 RepID=UPI0025AEA2C9|nr:pentatricopeptide repeat-containing protein At1g73710 [Malania oleifera]
MIAQSYSSRELGHELLQNAVQTHVFPTCELQTCPSYFQPRVSLGSSLLPQGLLRRQDCYFSFTLQSMAAGQRHGNTANPLARQQNCRGFLGFKLQCGARTLVSSPKFSSGGRKKRYGGVFLPSILRSLESEVDLEGTLNLYCGNLNPKEQTVILKEQGSWERVVRIFEWMKSQKEYLPNVIHYNIVLRALGRAQKWDELRLCWIEMARNRVLPTNNTYGMLVDVYGKAGLVKEALLWIKHMKSRGIFPDEVTMNTVVRVLKDVGEFDQADKFYKDWCIGRIELDSLDLDSIANSDCDSSSDPISFKHFLSTELFKTGRRVPPSKIVDSLDIDSLVRKPRLTATYNTLIDLYGKAGRLKDAADVFGEMLKLGVAMDVITFNTLIFTCGSHGHLSEAESLLSKMEERGIPPDTKTYNIFLSLYADAGNIDAALKFYRKIREVNLFPDIVTHRAVLHVLCQRNMVLEVGAVMEEMEKADLHIDEHSLPAVIKMYVNEGLLDNAKILFEKRHLIGGLRSRTYATIMDAYAEKGLWTEAEAVFVTKRDLVGQNKDVLEYNVMIKAYGRAKLYDKAFSLFRGMKNQGTWPDECTYNSLIQMFSGGDLVDQAMNLLAEMRGAGLTPQCLTFSAVIASYARLGRLSDAVDVYQEMARAGIKPNEVVFGTLINGFVEAGRVEEALQYLSMMEELGISENQIVLTSLIKAYSKMGCLEGAKQLYEKMKRLEGGPDIVASNSMINFYADLGMVYEAKLIFDNLKENGWADGCSFATMMHLYKSMGMLGDAIEVAEEMKQLGLLRDCMSFNQVMACYVAKGQLGKCGDLLHEMVIQKIFPDSGTFKVLFTALKKGGIPIEAVSQLESSYQEGKPYAGQAVITCVFSAVGLHHYALEYCEALIKAETDLDSYAYNVAIYAFGASGKIDKSLNIFMRMQDKGLEPDLVTLINLVHCYGKAGMIEGVKRVHSQLKYGDIEPNESLFKAVMDAYRNANRHELAELVNHEMRFAFDAEEFPDSEFEEEPDEIFLNT